MNTNLNFKDITGRLKDFVEYYKKTEVNDLNPCTENYLKISKSKTEDELYRLFLETHFQSPESAKRFMDLMNWEKLNTSGHSVIWKDCLNFFKQSKLSLSYGKQKNSLVKID